LALDIILTSFALISIAGLAMNLSLFAVTQLLHITTRGAGLQRGVIDPEAPQDSTPGHFPFISIHVPSYDEPPEMVSETLKSLSMLNYPHYEVILLDNNTPSETTWRPVERLCGTLGPRFRFIHVSGLSGAKAGALNLCLKESDPRAEYVAVVDADYQVDPDFLTVAVNHLRATQAAFVQFPQAFRGASGASEAVALELEDYFSVLARQAPQIQTPLLTGTLSVISKACLMNAGGWSHSSVTEDAELGVRLFTVGRVGGFCHRVVGRGLLPMSIDGLKSQRHRWILGNMQTLWRALRDRSFHHRAGAVSVLAQLSAWPAFWLAPIAVLLLVAMLPQANPLVQVAASLAASTILLSVLAAVARAIIDRKRDLPAWRGVVGPLAVKLALVWISSSAWLEPLTRAGVTFVKTPKTADAANLPRVRGGLAFACLMAAVAYAYRDGRFETVACAIAALSWPAARWVDAGLRQYGAANAAGA
jgi:cellulose synthase/poly-beta-1,6-N-acetylglucosamine synthase-like glycosyltransferase